MKSLLMADIFKPGIGCNLPEPDQDMLSQTAHAETGGKMIIPINSLSIPLVQLIETW